MDFFFHISEKYHDLTKCNIELFLKKKSIYVADLSEWNDFAKIYSLTT